MRGIARILSVIALVGLLLGIGVVGESVSVGAAGVTVTVNAPTEVVKGNSFTARIDISNVTAFDAGQFDVSFNETFIQLDSITAGLIGTTQIPVDLSNKLGTGTYRIIVNVPGVPGVSGSGYLAVLNFHAVSSAVGSSAINITNGFLNNNLGTEITATWTGDSVAVCDNLVITTTSLSDGAVGTAYSATLGATGGSGTYTWSLSSGSLPGGLTLGSTGSISGTPTTAGSFSFTVGVTDGVLSASQALTIKINPKLGDANGDGLVNASDVTKIERIIVQLDSPTSSADVNQDGKTNTADITKVERIIAGLS